jgi:poly(3-hydroxybutyrate) depolymerase
VTGEMTRRRFGRLGLAAGAALMLGTRRVRALEIEDGDGLITVTLGNRPVEIFTYKPPGFDPERSPLLIVLHGVGRDAEGYRDFARPIADAAQALVAAPRFDLRRFGHHAYQWAGIARLAGRTDTG